MELNNTTQYALRILNYINTHTKKSSLVSARLLSEELSIDYKFLTAVMTKLVKAGFLCSVRGKDGGFSLQRDGKDLYLIEIVELFGESFEKRACLLGIGRECNANKKCFLHDRWAEPKKELYDFFEKTTLEDLKEQGSLF